MDVNRTQIYLIHCQCAVYFAFEHIDKAYVNIISLLTYFSTNGNMFTVNGYVSPQFPPHMSQY